MYIHVSKVLDGVSGTGDGPRRYARQISHSSDLGVASGAWLAGAFVNRLLYRQRMHDSTSQPSDAQVMTSE